MRAMRTRGSARGQQAAQTAPNSVPEVAQAKTSAIVKRSSTSFLNRESRLTGATQVSQEKRAVAEGQWATTASTTANLGGAHVVVIKGLLPDAESLMQDERGTWEYTDPRYYNIRDIPLQMDDGNNGSGRQSYLIPDGGALAQALDERTAAIRARLGVSMVQRVGIASKASGLRQVMHYDYSATAYGRWEKKEKDTNKSIKPRPKKRYPWTLLVSLQPEGKLIILTSGGPVVVQLDAGDAVLFRYDVKHGGAAYGSKHMRLHEYWEPTGAGNIQFRVGNHHAGQPGGNQLHAIETEASWNKRSARSNPGKIYCGPTWAYDDVANPGKHIPGL